ncbi:YidC/Oxa1 family membrane protein insertase [Thalassobacillus cyri]|uniref:Membrane protein insertase YidC n=1 Tax=Thalassobacillus cyri TaxID=571932 RepID=A0A1H4FQF8_9BACI|nr:membrane protein insertase YidC [Thalassobacillus cyri]SEA98918.1 YidC/Oxa1 family membrane protein insertase [Thalassobacillus cyri]
MKRLVLLGSLLMMVLSGCSGSGENGGSFLRDIFVDPFSFLIEYTAILFDGSFGIAIVLITILIRLVLMPFTLKQYKNQQHMKEKMSVMQPDMKIIQEKLKGTDKREEQLKLQQEMMELYKKHGVNPMSMGCLPLLIQMPVLMGVYYAIQSSEEIASHSFLWFSLGGPDIPLALIAGVIYFFQFRVQQKMMPTDPANKNPMMRWMGLISPVMILVISFNMPAALPLYWSVGGLFLMVQTWLAGNMGIRSSKAANQE